MKSNHFSQDTKGYKSAKKWLQEIGEWENVVKNSFSLDGWTIVEAANKMYPKD